MAKLTNVGLVAYAISHVRLGTKYVMGTNCRVLTKNKLEILIKVNPAGWFTSDKVKKVRKWIGLVTSDCHGLVEGYCNDYDFDYVVEQGEGIYDSYANGAFNQARLKGPIKTMDKSIIGQCVRFPGHVGVYIGDGKVVEARGFKYGVCVTRLGARPWTHWYQHPVVSRELNDNTPIKDITPKSTLEDIVWLQWRLGVTIDGVYGPKTAKAYRKFARSKGWKKPSGWYVGKNGMKALVE